MVDFDLTYHVALLTPLHIGTGLGFTKMVDDTIVRAGPAKGGRVSLPCIPGSSIKGKTRSRCEALAHGLGLTVCGEPRRCKTRKSLCATCRLFGSPYSQGRLRFSDALLVTDWRQIARPTDGAQRPVRDGFALSLVRMGSKVERATRTVEPELLFSLEQSAEGLGFEGSIVGSLEPRQQPGLSLALSVEGWLLVIGLQAVDKLGGGRSRGLGRCCITITRLKVNGTDLSVRLPDLLRQDESILGVCEYEMRTQSNS